MNDLDSMAEGQDAPVNIAGFDSALSATPAAAKLVDALATLEKNSAEDPDAVYAFEQELGSLCEAMGYPAPELSHLGGELEFYYGDRLDLFGKTIATANSVTGNFEISLSDGDRNILAHQLETYAREEFEYFVRDFKQGISRITTALAARKFDTVVVLGNSGVAIAMALKSSIDPDTSGDSLQIVHINSKTNAEIYGKAGARELSLEERQKLLDSIFTESGAQRVAVLDDHVASGIKLDGLLPVLAASDFNPPLLIVAADKRHINSEVAGIANTSSDAARRIRNYMDQFSRALRDSTPEAQSAMKDFLVLPPELSDKPILREFTKQIAG